MFVRNESVRVRGFNKKKCIKEFSVDVKKETAKVKHEVYSSGSSVTTLSTKTLAEDLTICEEWKLSIDLKLPNRSTTEWKNIFSLYVDKNTGHPDQHILAVSVRPDQSNIMLMIAYEMSINQKLTYRITKKVNAGNWINLKISQMSGMYEVKVDYKLVYNKTNLVPKSWTNVKLITGKTSDKKNTSIVALYRNFKINTCKTKSKKLRLERG